MYFELLEKAAHCRREAMRCLEFGKHEFAKRWLKSGRGFIRTAGQVRHVFLSLDDRKLPG